MRRRLAIAALALGFLAGPALATLGEESCCCAQLSAQACDEDRASCESLAAAPCCDSAPATAPVPSAKRSLEGPVFELAAAPAAPRTPPPSLRPPGARDLTALVSPLRLSVVLRI